MIWAKFKSRWREEYGEFLVERRARDPKTRVDPLRFPEDEFPVQCLKCEYDLRSLSDGRCPECGEPFERGRLLIDIYVLLKGPRNRDSRIANRCLSVSLVLSVLMFIALGLFAWLNPQRAVVLGTIILWIFAILYGLSFALWFPVVIRAFKDRWKSRKVLADVKAGAEEQKGD